MRKGLALLAALALAPAAAAAARPALPTDGLVRIAAALTGLKAPKRVAVEVVGPATLRARAVRRLDASYPPGYQAYDEQLYRALGLLEPGERLRPTLLEAFANPKSFVVDGRRRLVSVPAGTAAGSLAVQGLIRLLQDGAFMLSPRIAAVRESSDAALAGAAAASGAAQLAARNLRVTDGAAPPPRTRAAAFLGLEAAFPSAVGTRLAANLYNVGGSAAVEGLLRRLPASTEQVFHVEKYLARERPAAIELPVAAGGWTLVRYDTFGELDVRALLAVFGVPRLDRVGTGWGGGVSAHYTGADGRQAVTLRLDWDTERDAQEWQEAVATYVNEAFDAQTPGPPATTPCQSDTCWAVGGRSIASIRSGTRAALVFGPDVPGSSELALTLIGG